MRIFLESTAFRWICNSTLCRFFITFGAQIGIQLEKLWSIVPVFEHSAFIIAAALSTKGHCAQKPGWWITAFHAEPQSLQQNEHRFFMTLSCIILNKQYSVEKKLINHWSWTMIHGDGYIFYLFCNLLCVENLENFIVSIEMVQIAHLSRRSGSELDAQSVPIKLAVGPQHCKAVFKRTQQNFS